MVLKRWRRKILAAALFGVVSVGAVTGQADEPTPAYTSEQINAILERLEKAEAEIAEIREEEAATQSIYAPDPSVFAAGPSTPIPVAFDDETEPTADEAVLERLAALEEHWESLDYDALSERLDGYDDEFDSIAKFHKSGVVIPGTSNTTMKLSGRIHLDYWTYPNDDAGANTFENGNPATSVQDRFTFRRIRLGAGGDIKDNMFYKFETEFADPNDFEFRDVYFGFKDVPYLNTVIIGNHKRPFGLDHLNSSRYNIFIERPFVIESFNEDARRLGISSNGVSDDEAWNWRFGVWNLERIQDDGQFYGDEYQLQVAGRLANTYWWDECSGGRGYAHWAISGSVANPDDNGGPRNNNEARFRTRPESRSASRWLNTGRIANMRHFEILGLEHVYNYGPLQWVSELQGLWGSRDAGSQDVFFYGGYTYVSYFLTGEHMPWDRKTGTLGRIKPYENYFHVRNCDGCSDKGWGAWQVAARYSYLDMNDADIFGGIGESITLSLVWYMNQTASLQFNYIHGMINNAAVNNGAGGTGVPLDSNYDILGARFRVDF